VHQHFQLIPVFTVAENIVLGDELRRGPVLDLETARKRIVSWASVTARADPDAKIEDLSVGQQQRSSC
jgi:simple sugar transport system ATP-binding protein